MSKRTRKEFEAGPGTRGPIVREVKPQVVPETPVADKAEEDLTQLGEMEAEAKAAEETAEQDFAEAAEGNPPGSVEGEASPMGFSTGGID